ncbi:hypothetical protein [Streptomyces sp. MUM 178J]|uniref:hypothetical protein n=1 Tax=Streptomyces sp. MUM 178J TaxID=2791991 RepID=UPI001F0387A3|nr:hypothetical protein [Streptomyces sp. MUM 178J]WRQ81570.1 hypothetical protein I3F59_020670 [Streptomyces sp. MUM 178J]
MTQTSVRNRRHRVNRAARAAGAIVALSVVTGACSGGSADTAAADLSDQPEITAEAAEVRHFADLPTMVATSDLVVEAKVVKAEAGACETDQSDQGEECVSRARLVTLQIDDVLHAKKDAKATTVQVVEGEWNAEGEGVLFNGVTWTKAGDKAVYFLHAGKKNYSLISSQGRVIVTGEQLQPTKGHDDKLRDSLGKMTYAQLTTEVERASKGFHSGRVAPLAQ